MKHVFFRINLLLILLTTLSACSSQDVGTTTIPQNNAINHATLDMSEIGKLARDKERIANLHSINSVIRASYSDKYVYPIVQQDECASSIQKDLSKDFAKLLPKIPENSTELGTGLCPSGFAYKVLTREDTGETYSVLATRVENQKSMNFDGSNWNNLNGSFLGTGLTDSIPEPYWYYVVGLSNIQLTGIDDYTRFESMAIVGRALKHVYFGENLPNSPIDQCLGSIISKNPKIISTINDYSRAYNVGIFKILNIPTGICPQGTLYKVIPSLKHPDKQILILGTRAENKENANFDGSNWDNIDEDSVLRDSGEFKLKRGDTISVITNNPLDWYMVFAHLTF